MRGLRPCGSPIRPQDMWRVCCTASKLYPETLLQLDIGGRTASSDPPLHRQPRPSRRPMVKCKAKIVTFAFQPCCTCSSRGTS